MPESLVEWLSARLDEDEAAARALGGVAFVAYLEGGDDGWAIEADPGGDPAAVLGSEALSKHIAAWGPARVLAEVAAKRRILALHEPSADHVMGSHLHCTTCCAGTGWDPSWVKSPCETLRLLALPYAGRDGYQDSWGPE